MDYYIKKINYKLVSIILLLAAVFFVFPSSAHAQNLDLGLTPVGQNIGLGGGDIRIVIARIIRVGFGLLGIVAVGLLMYGGYEYMTAGGEEDKISRAKRIIINSVIGLAIILSSYAIVSFVISRLTEAITTNNDLGGDGGGGGGSGGGGGGGGFGSQFYVTSRPVATTYCTRNIALSITFNREVDLSSVAGNIILRDNSDNSTVPGSWNYFANSKSGVVFTPNGSCSPAAGNDCLKANASYSLQFVNGGRITTLKKNPELTLSCTLGQHCDSVNFTAGGTIDRTPPTVHITAPNNGDAFSAGVSIPVKVTYTDDNGLQNLSLFESQGGNQVLVDSQSFSSCKKSDTITLNWKTGGAAAGSYTLTASGDDYAAQNSSDSINISLRSSHCFNGVLETSLGEEQLGPPECGGECGACSGAGCKTNSDCAGGTCTNGTCQNLMTIRGFSPSSGAPGTYVTINGSWFGNTPGHVYFAKRNQPSAVNLGDWVEALPPACGNNFDYWANNQIIVQVPTGIVSSTPIMVVTAPAQTASGTAPMTDLTSNHNIQNYQASSLIKPNLCAVTENSGVAGDSVRLSGKNFGVTQVTSKSTGVAFDNILAPVIHDQNNQLAWTDSLVVASVPGIESGDVGVKVIRNNVESNSVRFSVQPGASDTYPLIESITPEQGPKGEYITITGKNFGNETGVVWFKQVGNAQAPTLEGDFNFPASCKTSVWTNNKIVVKAPAGTPGTTYYVQVRNVTADQVSPLDLNAEFQLTTGTPAPGICSISPSSGPIPFPSGQSILVSGEFFTGANSVYFWNSAAQNPSSTVGRTAAQISGTATENSLSVVPAGDTITGPVSVSRLSDHKISNYVNFEVKDCTKAGNSCEVGHCCASGAQKGQCVSDSVVCTGETRQTGYIWRFSTQDIPPSPRVVERCDNTTESGSALPSPSPNIAWDGVNNASGDNHRVCKSALVTVEFTAPLDQSTVNAGTVKVNRCQNYDNSCVNAVPVTIDGSSYDLNPASSDSTGQHQFISLRNSAGWLKDVWYQVVLSNNIKAADGEIKLGLSADRPCGDGTAYCFYFKGGGQDCELRKVVVTPYNFFTKELEAPLMEANGKDPVEYNAEGLSDQKCIMLDASGYNWRWQTQNPALAAIYGNNSSAKANVSSLGNTVGIGLPGDAVNIQASADLNLSSGVVTKMGESPLTIDLSNPSVMDWWPKCQDACPNGEVGVRFNVALSTRNLDRAIENGSVQLLKCQDENCLSVTEVGDSEAVQLHESEPNVLTIAGNVSSTDSLEPNTLYKVVVSASTTNLSSPSLIWARGVLTDEASYGKPYNHEFSWRFRTKKDRCAVAKVEVTPANYLAKTINDRVVFSAQPYSPGDSCSSGGQKLNPWQMDWDWSSSIPAVATVNTFATRGFNQSCTENCVRKGSSIPSTSNVPVGPVCGNGKVEAGEDCDNPDKSFGCGLDCRFLGTTAPLCGNGTVDPGEACDPKNAATAQGCGQNCKRVGSSSSADSKDTTSSVCGNGTIGNGEDCDIGIAANVSQSTSAMNCSGMCLHTGSPLSSNWCYTHRGGNGSSPDFGGFTQQEYSAACAKAVSRCGDGVQTPDEDPGCDTGNGSHASWCNNYCLTNDVSHKKCTPNSEGCDKNGQFLGSSLYYSDTDGSPSPSVCGDGTAGLGEDPFCESGLNITRQGLTNPWALAIGQGQGATSGNPPSQRTNIDASTQGGSGQVRGTGIYNIRCGFKDDSDCSSMGTDYGVAKDSCCYARPRVTETVPANGNNGVCLNSTIEATFNGIIDQSSLQTATTSNIIIAKGERGGSCATGEDDVTSLSMLEVAHKSWFSRAIAAVQNFFLKIIGRPVTAATFVPDIWCAGSDIGSVQVSKISSTTSKISVLLRNSLVPNTPYSVILKDGIKDSRGVSIGRVNGNYFSWSFSTGQSLCEIAYVVVQPNQLYFSEPNTSAQLTANGVTEADEFIQPIPGVYDWKYIWEPNDSQIVNVPVSAQNVNTVSSKDKNGEEDVRAFAFLTANKISTATGTVGSGNSHVIVNMCENPWPTKNANGVSAFPYSDSEGNTSGFDLFGGNFDGSAIPPTEPPVAGDGYFNFSTYYCADKGSHGTADDYPYLKVAVQSAASDLQVHIGSCEDTGAACSSDGDCGNNLKCYIYSPFKRFIFTNDGNTDAIGIQIFPNPLHLSPEAWYAQDRRRGGLGFQGKIQTMQVDGYAAVSDGNNIYIGGLNYGSNQNLYDVVYEISINDKAKDDSRHIFEEMVKNLRLNTNVPYSDGYCGAAYDNPGFETKCSSDLDCPNGQVCSNSKAKLQRNQQRLQDLKKIDNALQTYKASHGGFPSVTEGSYISGLTISTWPSWTSFGSSLGIAAPTDPINKMGKAGTCVNSDGTATNNYCASDSDCSGGKCDIHDDTGWSSSGGSYSFACNPDSYAYRYNASGGGFNMRAHFENPGVNVGNISQYVSGYDFSSLNAFSGLEDWYSGNGICDGGKISTSAPGSCGDSVINKGEQCVPGDKKYLNCSGSATVQTCNSSCQWSAPSSGRCPSKCGNNVIEPWAGETCDDGVNNGKEGYCNTGCNGITGAGCPSSFCSEPQYATNKKDSCAWNCQGYGPYCGDGIVESDYEECEPGSVRACSGGYQQCESCRWGACQAGNLSGGSSTCGNGIREGSEACDDVRNGQNYNGVVCDPLYGSSCTYCSADCKDIIDIQGAYCGDGLITSPQEDCEPPGAPCSAAPGQSCSYCSSKCKTVIVNGPPLPQQ